MKAERSYKPTRIEIGSKKKIAFVCSGGGTKAGAFHLGVALALKEQGFRFFGGRTPIDTSTAPVPGPMDISCYVGSSAGSIIASFLTAGYSLDSIFNSFLGKKRVDPRESVEKQLPGLSYPMLFRIKRDPSKKVLRDLAFLKDLASGLKPGNIGSFLDFKWLKMSGLFSTSGIEQYMREEILSSNHFQDYLADLFIVATQLNHSRKVVFGKYHYKPPPDDLTCQYNNQVTISQACAASTALPFIYSPYAIGNDEKLTYYIDGEIRDTLSSHVAVDAGADLIIMSYTHQPYHYMKKIGSLTKLGLPAILVQSIYLAIEQKINKHAYNRKIQKSAIDAVSHYCRDNGVGEEHRKKIASIMEQELHYRSDVDYIRIHPRANDSQMFLKEHFSLSPKVLTDLVKSGFKSAINVLRHYEFEDRKQSPRNRARSAPHAHP